MVIHDLTDSDFQAFRRLIYEKSGIALNDGKKELLRTRLRSKLEKEGYPSYRAFFNEVKNDESAGTIVALLDAISTNLTSFFREHSHFDYMRKALPAMIEAKRKSNDTTLRIWSAGCSSGEEPYTVAFVLLEALGASPGRWEPKILGTDLSTDVLRRAMEGKYEVEKLSQLPQNVRDKYFTRETGEVVTKSGSILRNRPLARISPEVRGMVTFRRLNLMENFPFKRLFEIIFCRNVMIYFDKQTQGVLVNKFYDALREGGYLFIGHSESLAGLRHGFKYVQPTIYQK
ncbi:MAG: protein-glutamate O-methyltransferase CheR [Nitrospinae bacterium]|nr:protein-glutamate O-methyltransferase CheR [Nitrospinota bacterium]